MNAYEGFIEDLASQDESSRRMLDDLQLAAELGKTLLERNKELECSLKKHQHLIEDQAQEIEYLTKQNAALREINDSRLRIYETLDVGIQDLELERNRLLMETAADKKMIKTLNQTIENLESKCEELNKQVEDMCKYLDIEKRKNERLNESLNDSFQQRKTFRLDKPVKEMKDEGNVSEPETDEATTPTNSSKPFNDGHQIEFTEKNSSSTHSHDTNDSGFNHSNSGNMDNEEILKLVNALEDAKRQYINEHNRVAELEEQLSMIAQDNQKLQSQLAKMDTIDEMKSVHEELSILEEIRQGQLCNCLRNLEDRLVPTENTSLIGTDMEEDDRSLMDLLTNTETDSNPQIYRSAVTIKSPSSEKPTSLDLTKSGQNNPYRELVEKYEALLEVQRNSMKTRQQPTNLQDELLNSGDFRFRKDESCKKSETSSTGTRRKTPTEFSESETTSSGFSDETSNKATQTEERSGSFLCTIADGEDCKFTIYDDASPVDSRFRDRPKYRELFREIFTVLKKAAENKDEGDQLPLLDDQQPPPPAEPVKVPPVTPATEDIPVDFDAQSVISSAVSEQSIAVSECITKTERKKIKAHQKQAIKEGKENGENKPPTPGILSNRQSLEFYAIMNAKKKSRRSRRRSKDKYASSTRDSSVAEPSLPDVGEKEEIEEVPIIIPTTPTNSRGSKRSRRHQQQLIQTFSAITSDPPAEWNGHSLTIYNRNANAPKQAPPPWINENGQSQFRPSAASKELHKLRKLDLSYAEVLRRGALQNRRK